MEKKRWLAFLPLLALVACSSDTDPNGDEAPAPPDGSIRCSYYFRQSNEVMEDQTGEEPIFQFEERVLTVGPDESASEELGLLTFAIAYTVDEFEGDAFGISVTAGEQQVLSILYQLGDGLPQNQFVGGHGFTGLLYFTHPSDGGDYQAFCESAP